MTGLWLISYIALWILFLLVAVVLVSVLRNLGVMHDSLAASRGLHPPPTKLVAENALPEVTLEMLTGGFISLSEFKGTKTAFLVVSPGCSPCLELLKKIAENGANPDPLDPMVRNRVIISLGDILKTKEIIRQTNLSQDIPILVDTENIVGKKWGITATPITVIVDERLNVVRQVA